MRAQKSSKTVSKPRPPLGTAALHHGKVESLEGVILDALTSTIPSKQTKFGHVVSKSPGKKGKSKNRLVFSKALGKVIGVVHTKTARFRPAGMTDRRLIIEYAQDPENSGSVLMRITPTSAAPFPHAPPKMLTTQEAASVLSVSRPYVSGLVDRGMLKGVERTQAGHRRIPVAEVERVRTEMSSARRVNLNALDDLTYDLRKRELDKVHGKKKSRWNRKS